MEPIIEDSLEQIRQLCKKGYIDKALPILDNLAQICPGSANELLYERAVLETESGRLKEALIDFIKCYNNTASEQVLAVILSFSESNVERFTERAKRNRELLKEYPYVFGNVPSDCCTKILWRDESVLIYFDTCEKTFFQYFYSPEKPENILDESILLIDEFSGENIYQYICASKQKYKINDLTIPVYLYFQDNGLDAFLQCVELETLLQPRKLVLISGMEALEDLFKRDSIRFPDSVKGNDNDYKKYIMDYFINLNREREAYYRELVVENIKYYKENVDSIINRIKSKTPRVLFVTSRFTTALQYHAQGCEEALKRMGHEAMLLREQTGIESITTYEIVKTVKEFKPDVVFLLDHFRFEHGPCFPPSIVCVTWIQDPLDNIMDPSTINKLFPEDVLMTHLYSKEIMDLYGSKHLIDAPIPSDDSKYKPYDMSEEEIAKYSCDVCMVCHASDLDGFVVRLIENVKTKIGPQAGDVMIPFIDNYIENGHRGRFFYSTEEIEEFVSDYMKDKGEEYNDPKLLDYIVEEIHLWLNQALLRQVLADWLIEAGYENIKLWGNGWLKNPKYAKYAMGPAENGEVLSKINQASKIVLGNNILTSAAARAWETMLSGGFYLSNYIPPEVDWVDIRKIIKEGEDFIMFHDKKDFLDKVDFYLTHEEERQEMIRRGREAALKKMTYKSLMQKMLDEIPGILEEQGAFE